MAHVIHFKIAMVPICMLEEKRDAMFCEIFASTFQDMAQSWFIELPLKSINSFNKLVNKPIRKELHHIFSIIQENEEMIESYMRRFKMKKNRYHSVPNL